MRHRKTHKTIRKRERREELVIFISIAAPQDPGNHQKRERELVIFISIVALQDPGNHQKRERELVIFISNAAPQDPGNHQKRERESVANFRHKHSFRMFVFKISPLFKIYLNHPVSSCKSRPARVPKADAIASINYVSCLLLTLNQTSSSISFNN